MQVHVLLNNQDVLHINVFEDVTIREIKQHVARCTGDTKELLWHYETLDDSRRVIDCNLNGDYHFTWGYDISQDEARGLNRDGTIHDEWNMNPIPGNSDYPGWDRINNIGYRGIKPAIQDALQQAYASHEPTILKRAPLSSRSKVVDTMQKLSSPWTRHDANMRHIEAKTMRNLEIDHFDPTMNYEFNKLK